MHTTTGIFYILRFGEVAYGAPDSRYLIITVGCDPSVAPGPMPEPVRRRHDVLRARFAPWHYLVSNDNFKKIRLERRELIRSRPAPVRS